MDVHAHLMSRGLATGTVVRKNEGEVDGMVVGIRCKVPLLLWLVMNLVGAIAVASELQEKVKTVRCKSGTYTYMLWRILIGRK